MTLSFIIIAYNEGVNILSALDSIYNQDELPKRFEVIVVNDGSNDNTLSVVKNYSLEHSDVKIIDLKTNQGRGAARAAGLEASAGKFVAFVDADIILPANWLAICMQQMEKYDVCGGTAVPDGDVTWIYNKFKLRPKLAAHTTVVTGSNGLYRRSAFSKIAFNQNKKDGEDVDLGHQISFAHLKASNLKGLVVEHHERKSYLTTLRWLFVSGKSASKQLYEYKKLRLADLAFGGFLALFILSVILAAIYHSSAALLVTLVSLLVLYVTAVSYQHMSKKFYLRSSPLRASAAVLANSSLLLAYFCGRFVGLFNKTQRSKNLATEPKKIAIFFDYESVWGMPWKDQAYDLTANTMRLLDTLDRYNATATFFVVGKIVETEPELIKAIAARGHQIGLHGYEHENLSSYSPNELAIFGKKLANASLAITALTGQKPTGFRSPHLMGPSFYSSELYNLLHDQGYAYVSNREIRYQQELFHPKRLRLSHWLDKDNFFTKSLMIILNLRLLITDNTCGKSGLARLRANVDWLLNGCVPFKRHQLLEVPLYSPLDCDLLGLPKPGEHSSQNLIDYSVMVLMGGLNKKGELYSLNFHDWIIGSDNRVEVLDKVLEQIQGLPNTQFISGNDIVTQFKNAKLGSI